MPSLDVRNPGMPDLQFALLVLALCTSDLDQLNVTPNVRADIFNRCWALLHTTPPPTDPKARALDLRQGTELTLEAVVETIQSLLAEANISTITWDHPVSDPTMTSSPDALPLIERLQRFSPPASDPSA